MGKLFNSRSLPDALMGGFALFSLKDPSLTLQAKSFEERRISDGNLRRI